MESDERLGHCYSQAYDFVMRNQFGILVHGEIRKSGSTETIDHAWVKLPGKIYEPNFDKLLDNDDSWVEVWNAREHATYDLSEAAIALFVNMNYGPWDEQGKKLREA